MKINKKILGFSALAIMALTFSEQSMAASTAASIGDMATSAESNIQAIKKLAMSVFYMIGLFLFGMGLFLLYKDQKTPNQGHAKNGFISIIVGVALLLIPQLVTIVGTSMGATGASAEAALKSSKGFE